MCQISKRVKFEIGLTKIIILALHPNNISIGNLFGHLQEGLIFAGKEFQAYLFIWVQFIAFSLRDLPIVLSAGILLF